MVMVVVVKEGEDEERKKLWPALILGTGHDGEYRYRAF
jgi:hypothetical protein